MTTAAPASAYFRTWRDLEALLATQRWTVRASPAIGDGADVLYFVPPEGSDIPTVQVRHLGKALQASVWALRGSAGSMMALDPDTAASVEPRKPQWRVEAMAPDHPVFDTRDSFTLVCGDVLVALGLMERPVPDHRDALDALGYGLALTPQQVGGADAFAAALAADAPPRETATEALQRRLDAAAALDPAFTVHDAGYSPDHFGTTADMVEAARLMDLMDGDDVSDADLQAVMAMPLDAPGRDEAMTRVFGDDRRNWPGDPHDVDRAVFVGLDLGTSDLSDKAVGTVHLRQQPARGFTREQFATALMAAKRKPPAWRRFLLALGRLAGVVGRRLQAGL